MKLLRRQLTTWPTRTGLPPLRQTLEINSRLLLTPFALSFNSSKHIFLSHEAPVLSRNRLIGSTNKIQTTNRDNTMTGVDTLQFVRVVPHNHTTTTTGEMGKAFKLHYKWKHKILVYFLEVEQLKPTSHYEWFSHGSSMTLVEALGIKGCRALLKNTGEFRDDWSLQDLTIVFLFLIHQTSPLLRLKHR